MNLKAGYGRAFASLLIVFLLGSIVAYAQPSYPYTHGSVHVQSSPDTPKDRDQTTYAYPRYRDEMHAGDLALEIKEKLGYKLMAEFEGDKVDGYITIGDAVVIVMPKLSEKEKEALDEIVKNHYSEWAAKRIKERNMQPPPYPDDLTTYAYPRYRPEMHAGDLAKEIESELGYRLMARHAGDKVDGYVSVESSVVIVAMPKLTDEQKTILDQIVENHYSEHAALRLKLHSEDNTNEDQPRFTYNYPRYRDEMHAGDLALEIKEKLGYKLMAEFEGDKVDGYIQVGDVITIAMFKPLTPEEKKILDQIVENHYSERAAEILKLHGNTMMATYATYPRLALQYREPYVKTIRKERLPGVVEDIEIEFIRPSRRPLRLNIGVIEDLMVSLKEKSLLQPILVRPIGIEFEVVAGNRRLEACKRLGWKKVPCIVIEMDDREAFEISLIENIQRNSMNPIEEALAFKKYVEDYGWGGISDLARRIGKSPNYVSRRIKLLGLPQHIQQGIVRSSAAGVGILQELITIPDEFTRNELAELTLLEDLQRDDVRRIVRHFRNKREDEEAVPKTYDDILNSYDRAIRKSIAVLKISLIRLDEIINTVDMNSEYSWIIRDLLLENRKRVHGQIDFLHKLRRKISKLRRI